jgi:hypothetical protein
MHAKCWQGITFRGRQRDKEDNGKIYVIKISLKQNVFGN